MKVKLRIKIEKKTYFRYHRSERKVNFCKKRVFIAVNKAPEPARRFSVPPRKTTRTRNEIHEKYTATNKSFNQDQNGDSGCSSR